MIRPILVLIVFASVAEAQTAPARQPAETHLAETLRRHGGNKLNEVSTIRLRGTRKAAGVLEPVVISATMEGSSRIDYGRNAERSTVTTADGRYDVREGKKEYRPSHSGVYAQLDVFSVLGIRNTYGSGGNRGVVGNRELKGTPTILIHAGKDRQQTFYNRVVKDETDIDLDAQTGLVAAVHRVQSADDSLDMRFTTSSVFSDYRNDAGVLLPFRIERYMDGVLRETIVVESYEINPIFDRDLFER